MSSFGFSTGSSGGVFGGSNTSGSNTNTSQPNLFGNKSTTGGGLFGGTSGGTTSGTTRGLFGTNTGGTARASGGLFGGGSTASATGALAGTNIFGSTTSTSPAASSTAAPTSIFGSTSNATPGAAPTSLFGTTSTTTPASTTAGTTPTNSLFGGTFPSKPADQNAAKPAGTSSFGQPSTSIGTTTTPTAAPATGGGPFSQPAKPDTTTTTPASGTTTNTAPPGGLFGKPAAATTPLTSAPAPPAGGLFGGSGAKPAEKKDGTSPVGTPTPTFGLFGAKPAGGEKDVAGAPATGTFTLRQTAPTKPVEAAAQGTSVTTAVAVAPPSMLRGKTIEEIVNKWSTELETHVREFNKFAGEVTVWDRALIENGNNLAALYSHVLASEREQNDIDQSLDHVEQQQQELGSTLDAYEKVTQEILGSQGGGLRALDTGPADTERDKNYILATDLHTHLDDLSDSLTQMIDTVNNLSLPSNDSGTAEDPMAQIAQILSSHLESLQWIDGAVRDVESKVSDVEKRVKESGHSLPATNQKGRLNW